MRGRIESVLDYAKAKGWRTGENPAAWKGNLAHLLPRRQKVEQEHFAAMGYREIPAFVEKLRQNPTVSNLAIEFLILTATRSGETRAGTWDEIDLDRATWTLPPGRMKAGLAHTVPLSPRAIEILRQCASERRSNFVFPGRSASRPISSSGLLEILPKGTTLHGMRSTFRVWCAEQTSFPREICEEALAHAVGSQVERAYRRTDMLERRRELMSLWAQFCEPEASANVTSIAKAVR